MQQRSDYSAMNMNQQSTVVEAATNETAFAFDGDDFYGYDRNSIFVHFFLIIDEIIKAHIWHPAFYFCQYIAPFLQIFISIFWPFFVENWDISGQAEQRSMSYFVRGFASILTLSDPRNALEFNLTSFIAVAAIYSIVFVVLTGCFIYYYFGSRSFGGLLPIFIFFLLIITRIFYLPAAAIFSSTLGGLQSQDGVSTFAFIYMLITYLLATAYIYITELLINYISNPNRSCFACFNGKHNVYCLVYYSLHYLFYSISQFLPSWFLIFVIALKIIGAIYLMYDIFSIPYFYFYTNIFLEAVYSMTIVSDIIVKINMPPFAHFFIPIAVFMIAFIVFLIIFNIIKKKVLQNLESHTFSNDAEEFKISSLTAANQHLNIGFIFHSKSVFDGSFSFYIAHKMSNIEIWIMVTGIMSFIPSEKSNFSLSVVNLKQLYSKKLIEKLRILHFIKLEQHKYLTSTNEINRRLMSLKAASNDAIILTKRFWSDVSKGDNRLILGTLNNIAGVIIDAKNQWKNSLNMFPNEYRFSLEYSNFLVECCGKFEKGMYWLLKAEHLERGISGGIDEIFRTFVCSNPSVIYDGVIDRNGNLINDKSVAINSSKNEQLTQDQLEEEVENGMIEKLMSERFLWPSLRSHLSNATAHYRPKYLSLFTVLKYIMFIIILIFLIVLNVEYTTCFTFFDNSYTLIESINQLRVNLGYLKGSLMLQWAKSVGIFYTLDLLNQSNIYQNHDPAIDLININNSLVYWMNRAQLEYVNLFKSISYTAIQGESIAALSEQLLYDNVQRSFCTLINSTMEDNDNSSEINSSTLNEQQLLNFEIKTVDTNAKSLIMSMIWSMNSLLSTNFSILQDNSLFCEYNLLSPEICEAFSNVSSDFSSFVIKANNNAQSKIKVLIAVFLVIAIVIWIPLIIIPQFIVQKESLRVFSALKSIDKNAATIASQKLALNEQLLNNDYVVSQQHTYSFSSVILIWRLLYALLVITILICAGVSYDTLSKTCNKLQQIILLSHFGASRHGQSAEVFALVVYNLIGTKFSRNYMNFDSLYELFMKYMNELTDNSNYFIHGENNNGMSKYDEVITNLHIDDSCESPLGDEYVSYKCLSFQRAISTFLIAARGMLLDELPENPLNTTKFLNFLHISVCEMNELNQKSRDRTTYLVHAAEDYSLKVTIALLTIAIILDIIAIIIDILFDNMLKRLLKTALLLIRHLPPPAIAESPQLLNILLVQTDRLNDHNSNTNEVIFNSISVPVVLLGEGCIIEAINNSFQSTFGVHNEQVVGHHLSCLIPNPGSEEIDMTPEEQGAFHLYEKMNLILSQESDEDGFSYMTKLISNEDETMIVKVSVHIIKNKENVVSGFILIIEDLKQIINVEERLSDVKKNADYLMNQLIPRKFSSIIEEKGKKFSFVITQAFVVVVHINVVDAILEKGFEEYDALISLLESDAFKNPPFLYLKTVYDLICFVGGIFEEKEMKDLAYIALDLTTSIMKTLNSKLKPIIDEKRFSIAIACGGPLLGGIIHSKNPIFDVSGDLITEASKIAMNASNEVISFSKDAREYITDEFILFQETHNNLGTPVYVNINQNT